MIFWQLQIAPKFLPKWGIFGPKFCIFGQKFSNKKNFSNRQKLGGAYPASQPPPMMPLLQYILPSVSEYVCDIQLIMTSFVPRSGAGTSIPGPKTQQHNHKTKMTWSPEQDCCTCCYDDLILQCLYGETNAPKTWGIPPGSHSPGNWNTSVVSVKSPK